MRFILEGGCGVGKSTLARALGVITGVPVYRPFRGQDEHISQQTIRHMQDLGLSVNGWEEDLYTADFLSVVHSDVIIDRSMPSALAYNEVSERALEASQRRAILGLWAERIVAARAIVVLVVCNEDERKRRSPSRGGAWECDGILNVISEAAYLAPKPGFAVWRVNSGRATPEALAQVLARRAIGGHRSSFIDTLADPSRPGVFDHSFKASRV